jgi:beta-glucosidase
MVRDYVDKGYLPKDGLASLVLEGDMARIAAATDFLGVNYYNRAILRSQRIAEKDNLPRTVFAAPSEQHTDIGWEVYPEGMFETLMRVHLEYRPPKIYVTENGASYGEGPDAAGRISDARRVGFLRDHLVSAHRALEVGVPLAGYFAWSLLDNYEWDHGYTQRFGITWVDYATQKRTPKDSAHWYRRVIEENAVE